MRYLEWVLKFVFEVCSLFAFCSCFCVFVAIDGSRWKTVVHYLRLFSFEKKPDEAAVLHQTVVYYKYPFSFR